MKVGGRIPHSIAALALLCCLPGALSALEPRSTVDYKKQYTFTHNTFTDKPAAWTKLLADFRNKPNIGYLEIGTFEGRSALWILENILTHPTAKLTIVDAFEEHTHKTFVSNVNLSGEAAKFTILSGPSTQKLRELPFKSFDLAYIDGSGRGIVMFSDLVSTWNLMKVGGMIICSRYSLTPGLRKALNLRPEDPGPHEAIDAFLKLYNPYISVASFQGNYVAFWKRRSAE